MEKSVENLDADISSGLKQHTVAQYTVAYKPNTIKDTRVC